MANGQPTSVYLYFDRDGILLYVGVTNRRTARQAEHRTDKEWWQYVARQEIEHYPDRTAALSREAALIASMCPPFNTVHNPDRDTRGAYLALASDATQEVMPRKRLPLVVCSVDSGSIILRTLPEHARLTHDLTWASDFDSSAERRRVKHVQLARVGAAIVVRVEVADAVDFLSGELMTRQLPNGPEVKRIDLSTQ